jgi:hypothetical protein
VFRSLLLWVEATEAERRECHRLDLPLRMLVCCRRRLAVLSKARLLFASEILTAK